VDKDQSWMAYATRRDIFTRALRVGLIVGTILALINHGDRIIGGTLDMDSWSKIILTYLVPYSVSTWSSVQAVRAQEGR